LRSSLHLYIFTSNGEIDLRAIGISHDEFYTFLLVLVLNEIVFKRSNADSKAPSV